MQPGFTGESARVAVLGALVVGLAGWSVHQAVDRSRYEREVGRLLNQTVRDPAWIASEFNRTCYDRGVFWDLTWLGVRTEQNPSDVWMTQEILFEVRPDLVVETGTQHGGSAALWATILREVNPAGRVVTIDIEDKTAGNGAELAVFRERVEFLLGSSTDPRIVSAVAARARGKKVLVILDSDHSRDHVAGELRAYAPLVSVGSYLIVQDTSVNGHPVYPGHGPGPMEAVEEFLVGNPQFQVDRSRERLLLTLHPKGYLKRVS